MKKTKIAVVAESRFQGTCNCGWAGLVFVADSGLSTAIQAAQDDISDHKCIPKPKKARKPRKKAKTDD